MLVGFLALAALWSGLEFHEENIPGLHVQGVDPLTGELAGNFRTADLDGDGFVDLILPDRVLFQREGVFALDTSQVLPRAGERPLCDVFGGAMFFRFSHQLEIYRWARPYWQATLSHEQAWPDISDDAGASGGSGVRFGRFLHDYDGDAIPEIVAMGGTGISIYGRVGSRYELKGRFDVLPPAIAVAQPQTALWPPAARQYRPPLAQMACTLVTEGPALRVLLREAADNATVRYRERRFTIAASPDGALALDEAPDGFITAALPNFLQPCRLNNDDRVDFAGGAWSFAETSVFPTPVYETCATLDGGETLQRVRTEGFRPGASLVDMDGDGDADIVTERTGLLDGGIRESITRFLTRKTIQHEIRIFNQDGLGHFSSSPDIRFRFSLELDATPFKRTEYFRRYRAGELIDVTGDLNGDGYRDVLVQTRPDEVTVFRNTGSRIEKTPEATILLPAGASFTTADINGDGRSDVVVRWRGQDADQGEVTRVFFSRNSAP